MQRKQTTTGKNTAGAQLLHFIKTAICILEVVFFAGLPVVAFGMSGRYTEHSQLVDAGMENLTMYGDVLEHLSEEEVIQVNAGVINGTADAGYEDILPKLGFALKGVINTGRNVPGIYDIEKHRRDILQNTVYSEEAFLAAGYVPEKYAESLIVQAQDDVRVANILACAEYYPEELLEMLAKYPETVNFVSEYLYEKDSLVAETIGTVKPGEIPLLLQWDKRWGYAGYGDFMIATTGCGPTCVAMVAAGLTRDASITPKVVADYAEEHGYYEYGVGSKWTLMSEGVAEFGITGTAIALSETEVYDNLEAGHPIICSVGAGDFTTEGHFIVLAKLEEGKIRVNDPNSSENSARLWTYEELAPQIRNLWAFSCTTTSNE